MSELVKTARMLTRHPYMDGKAKVEQSFIDALADRIETLEAKLRQIHEMGPMTVDDQRWRIAGSTLKDGT